MLYPIIHIHIYIPCYIYASAQAMQQGTSHIAQNLRKVTMCSTEHLASREVLYNILDCYIAFRVCYIGKTGMLYTIYYITCAIYHVIYIYPYVIYIAI